MKKIYDSRKGNISDRTIDEINQLSPMTLESFGVIHCVEGKDGEYVCPFCNNGGNGNRDATGIKPKISDSHVDWKCQRCGEKFNNVQIFALHYGLNPKHDFRELVERICSDFGISIEYDDFTPTPRKKNSAKRPTIAPPKQIKAEPQIDSDELAIIREDLSASDEPLRQFVDQCGGAWRGLPFELLKKKGCKFIANWTPPIIRVKNKFSFQTPRILLPSSSDSYLARFCGNRSDFDETTRIIEKQHVGRKCLFGADALNIDDSQDKFVFVVEGAVDTLSIELAGFNAVALNGAADYQLLVDAVADMKVKPRIAILLDSDETGRKFAPILRDELLKKNCLVAVNFFFNDFTKIDANDILIEEGLDNLRSRLDKIAADAQKQFATIERNRIKLFSDDEYDFYFSDDRSDLANARRLEKFCGADVRWLSDDERWLVYGGGVWQRGSDKSSALLPLTAKLYDTLIINAQTNDDYKTADNFKRAGKAFSAISYLRGCDSILIKASDLDNHTELLNVLNGVVDLTDGKLYPHLDKRDSYITQQCRAAYYPDAKSELVTNFFHDIQPDEMTCAGFLRWLGYNITGEVSEEKFMIWQGGGGNGKGVTSKTILYLLGSYAVGLPSTALLRNRKNFDANVATTSLNALDRARFSISEELPLDSELDSALIKNLSGGDDINLRRNYGEYRTIQATAKLNLSGNFLPKLENVDDLGLRRRMLNMPFTVQFGGSGKPADRDLKKKLLEPSNLNALLALLVREAVAWYRRDDGGLIISDIMRQATERHLSESDFVADFIDENYIRVANAQVKSKDFLDALRAEYPRETNRYKRADLIRLICNVGGIEYGVGNGNARVFKGIGKLGSDFDGEPVAPDETPPDLPF